VSGTFRIKIDCRTEGPLANGDAEKAAEDWATSTTQAIADEGVKILSGWPMDKTGRAAGGFQENLRTKRVSPTLVRIPGPTVRGVVFAPWLEGTSKRSDDNSFKGYHLFRKTRTQLGKVSKQIAQEELEKVLPRMGGD
jgi:hypothetical protein